MVLKKNDEDDIPKYTFKEPFGRSPNRSRLFPNVTLAGQKRVDSGYICCILHSLANAPSAETTSICFRCRAPSR